METKLAFQITRIDGTRLWPASIYPKDADYGERELKDIELIQENLEKDHCIFVQSSSYDKEGNKATDYNGLMSKNDIAYIQGPIRKYDSEALSINEVYSLSEATTVWGMPDGSTIRKAIERDKFRTDEFRKSESVNLVTHSAMQRLFDAVPKSKLTEVPFIAVTTSFLDEAPLLSDGEIAIHKVPKKRNRKHLFPDELIPAFEGFSKSLIIDKGRFFDNLRCANVDSRNANYKPTQCEHNLHLAEVLAAAKEAYSSGNKVYMLEHRGYQSVTNEEDIEYALNSIFRGWGNVDKALFLSMLKSDASEMLGMQKIVNYDEIVYALSQ